MESAPSSGHRPPGRARGRAATAALACALALGAAAPAPGAQIEILYLHTEAARAIHDAGVSHALRQAPMAEPGDPRWPLARQVGKVSGAQLSRMSAGSMAAALRRAWRAPHAGGRVAVDEISRREWGPKAARRLRIALAKLGPRASRVILYLSPTVVEGVGRVDPRQRLPYGLRTLVATLANGGGEVFLELYRGGWAPLPAPEMAAHLTRWHRRWPAGALDRLHVLIGPSQGIGQQALWDRVRATPAGRRLLANGPGAIGLDGAPEGIGWARAYQLLLVDPGASPPGGDAVVPRPGGLRVVGPRRPRPGANLWITTNRAGRAVVRLLHPARRPRAFAKVVFDRAGRLPVRLPRDVRPGGYRVLVTFRGGGLGDRASLRLVIRRRAAAPG